MAESASSLAIVAALTYVGQARQSRIGFRWMEVGSVAGNSAQNRHLPRITPRRLPAYKR